MSRYSSHLPAGDLDLARLRPGLRGRSRRGSTSERGYGGAHQRLRRVAAAAVAAGSARCGYGPDCLAAEETDGMLVGGLIGPGDAWHLGHDDLDRSRYIGPVHRDCNLAFAGRPPAGAGPSRDW